MARILRYVAAIAAGIIVALVLLSAIEYFSAVVYPTPPDFKGTMEEMCLHVSRYPAWVLAVVVPMWAGTAFASTWISGWIGNRVCALCIGLLLIAALVFNVSMLPYPIWFKILILLAVPAAVLLGAVLSKRRITNGKNEMA